MMLQVKILLNYFLMRMTTPVRPPVEFLGLARILLHKAEETDPSMALMWISQGLCLSCGEGNHVAPGPQAQRHPLQSM